MYKCGGGRAARQAGADETIKKRIEFLRIGLSYAPICREYIFAKKRAESGDPVAIKKVEQLKAQRIAWLKKLGFTWALNAPSLMRYNY